MLAIRIGFLEINWAEGADIVLVGLLMYEFYRLIRGSVASNIIVGVLMLLVVHQVVKAAGMELLTAILDQLAGVGVVAILILFQQEIRKFLLMLGKGTSLRNDFLLRRLFGGPAPTETFSLQPALDAAKSMSQHQIGGLIVFAGRQDLSAYAETGDSLDGELSKRLLLSIFFKNSPLHDGAVVVVEGRIKAARCILPVSEQPLSASLGLRHRAALGITEHSDAAVLVVSEQTGQISIAYNGRLDTNISIPEAKARLNHYLFDKPLPATSIPGADAFAAPQERAERRVAA